MYTEGITQYLRMRFSPHTSTKGFTLTELLIVVAVVLLLAVTLVIVVNPVETFRHARDVQRIRDLAAIRTAVTAYLTVTPLPVIGNCAATPGAKLPTIYYSGSTPSPSESLVAIDGTGWIPINFAGMTGGSPLAVLPRDPAQSAEMNGVNATTLTYRYGCATNPVTFEVDARFESRAFGSNIEGSNKHATDGGNNPELYEVGTNLNILPASGDF